MKKLITFLMLFAVFGGSKMWADDNLLNENFTTWSTQEATINGANTLTENTNIVFYNASNSKHFKVTNGKGIELADNNLNNNYFIAIPLSGIRNTITVTITHEGVSEKTVTYDYILGDGETSYSTATANGTRLTISDAANGATSMTKTINCTNASAVLYIGRHNSDAQNKTPIKSITITTPSSGVLTLAAARNYTWKFNDNNETAASETATVLANGNYNFEIKNAAITTVSSTNVEGLANGITKQVYFDGMGSTSNKYVHVKVQGPCEITAFGRSVSTEERYLIINCGGTLTEVKAGSSSDDVTSGSYFYTGTEEADVYIYSKNSGIYFFGLVVKPTLSQFEFNAGDVLYYKDDTTREFVNNTTFEYNATYDYLRTKLIIDPDYNSLTNPTFSVTSSDNTVLDVTTVTPHFYRASDNRIYVDNIKVLKAGTATLTFTFNGADNYAGPVSVEQVFNITAGQAPTIAMETPSPTSDVPVSTSIVLTSDRTISAVGETITGTLNGKAITFTLTDGNTLTYTPASNLANGTLYTVVLNSGQVKGTNNLTNAESTFTFTTIAAVSSLSAVSDKVWNFGDWSTGDYTSTIITSENIEIISANYMTVDLSNKTFDDTDEDPADNLGTIKLTRRIKTGGESSASNRLIHFKVKKGATISVLALSQGSGDRTLNLCVGSYDKNNPTATLATNTTNVQKLKYTYNGDADEADIYLGSTGGIGIYYIKVSKNKTAVSMRPGGSQPGNSAANPLAVNTTSFNYLIVTTVDGGSIRDLFPSADPISSDNFEISSSNSSIVNVSKATYSASEDDLSKGRFGINGLSTGNQGGTADITLHYKGTGTYSEATTTFTLYVNGPEPFDMNVSNLTVQNGQQVAIMPTITNQNGEPIGFDGSGNVIILDEDADVDYNNYFNFAYSIASNDAGLSLDPSDNSLVVSEEGDGYVGKTATVTVTATPKSEYAAKFTNASAIKTLAVEVIAKETVNYIDFWLDENKTTRVTDVYSYTLDGSTSVFENFPNGRIIYVDIKDAGLAAGAEEIWFSYNVGSSVKVTPSSAGKTDYGKKQYLLNMSRGGMVPVHIDGEGTDVFVNFQCFKRTGKDSNGNILYESVGSVIPVKFTVASHDRPAVVTYDPVSDGTLVRNTAQSVVAIGTSGITPQNHVYAKFSSTGTNYTIEGLLNEPNVIDGYEKIGVFSTEVSSRKISGVQIQMYGGEPFVSTINTMTYDYRYATTLTLSQTLYDIDLANPSFTKPTYTASYYDKVKKTYIDETDAEGAVTYKIDNYNGANASINSTTGDVTKSTTSGMSVVTVTYDNTTSYTVNKRTNRMDVATATYTIYWVNSNEHSPKIEPVSQKFYPTINVKVTADKDWDTWYIIKGTEEAAPNAATIQASGTKVDHNTNTNFNLDATKVVYAVAFDGTNAYTKVISETYTRGEEVLPTYFVPDGSTSTYNYYTETLDIEARTNTAGASVYYTMDGTDPVIGASNTYLYDGLRGITLTDGGTTTIKAIAVKDGIQSSVTTSEYQQSPLDAPFFYVNGTKNTEATRSVNTTDAITIASDANAGSYKLVYYYTLDGSEPTSENGILATTAFNVVKTVDAKAIAVLVDANGNEVSTSDVTTVRFKVTYSENKTFVWEAVSETTPDGKMLPKDGFVISTNCDLKIGNTGSIVNKKSLNTSAGGTSTLTYAQNYITATFGGFEHGEWKHFTISDEALGSPIDGVGEYNIRSNPDADEAKGDDAKTEQDYMYSHLFTGSSSSENSAYYTGKNSSVAFKNPETTHEKTFNVPSKGAFVRFEPERDGELTIWALQQGGVHYDNDSKLCDRFVRRRPVYFVDEQGKSYKAKVAVSSARLSTHWTTIVNKYASEGKSAFTPLGEKQNGVSNNFYDQDESEAIYNMFLDYFMKRGDYATGYGSGIISVGDPIQPIPIHTSSRATNPITERGGHNIDNSTDMTGYVLASGGYVKYTFEVKAGKTYYFFGHATKIGIRGFQFVPTEDDDAVKARSTVTINADETTPEAATAQAEAINNNVNTEKPINVNLKRAFAKNTWTTLVLPFSISETQLEKKFGEGVDVIHFDDITNDGHNIHLVRHWYKMIVAGTPVLIRPTVDINATDGVTFEGVRIETNTIDEITGSCDDYTMKATYQWLPAASGLKQGDYYVNTRGNFKRLSTESSSMKATRAWLRPKDVSTAKALSMDIANFDDEGGTTTGIINIEFNDDIMNVNSENGYIYNLSGQLVSTNGSTKNLSKGVYIKNGKKIVVE